MIKKLYKDFFITSEESVDWTLLGLVIALSLLGVIYSYSSQLQIYGEVVNKYGRYVRQSYFLIVGIVMLLIIRKINYRKMLEYHLLIYIVSIALLIYTLLNGEVVNNSKRWISLVFFNIQPSEFVKIALVVFVAGFIEKKGAEVFSIKNWSILSGLLVVPTLLIFLQPDLGTALLFIPTVFIMLWLNGLPFRFTMFIICIFSTAVSLLILSTYAKEIGGERNILTLITSSEYMFYFILFFIYFSITLWLINIRLKIPFFTSLTYITFSILIGLIIAFVIDNYLLKEYQRQRLVVFLNPSEYRWDYGYNIVQSQITIGSGGLWGKGLFNGNYSQLGFLPSRTTDFIFSVVAEELGFIGASIVILMFFLLLYRIWKTMIEIKDTAGRNILLGIFCIFSMQILINIGMTISLFPVTGIPLPFVSAGGSTLISSLLGMGIVFSIQSKRWVNRSS